MMPSFAVMGSHGRDQPVTALAGQREDTDVYPVERFAAACPADVDVP